MSASRTYHRTVLVRWNISSHCCTIDALRRSDAWSRINMAKYVMVCRSAFLQASLQNTFQGRFWCSVSRWTIYFSQTTAHVEQIVHPWLKSKPAGFSCIRCVLLMRRAGIALLRKSPTGVVCRSHIRRNKWTENQDVCTRPSSPPTISDFPFWYSW
jgi:hypothetical protein